MEFTLAPHPITVDLPAASEVSDGSVFGPDGLEFAVYADPEGAAPTDVSARRDFIEGRSPVASFRSETATADGWLVLFETEDGERGFELGRRAPGKVYVFWADRLRDDAGLELAVNICKSAKIGA